MMPIAERCMKRLVISCCLNLVVSMNVKLEEAVAAKRLKQWNAWQKVKLSLFPYVGMDPPREEAFAVAWEAKVRPSHL